MQLDEQYEHVALQLFSKGDFCETSQQSLLGKEFCPA